MEHLSIASSVKKIPEVQDEAVIEVEMQALLRDLEEELQFEKLPFKIKKIPKTIYHLESSPLIFVSHI